MDIVWRSFHAIAFTSRNTEIAFLHNATGWAVIPYCGVRACIAIAASPEENQLKRLNETITTHTRLLAEMANAASKQS